MKTPTELEPKRLCTKCGGMKKASEFYKSKNLAKYPDGYISQCKKCITMHIDNWVPETYLWILQECDVPYIPDEWNKLLKNYGKDKSTVTGATIIGRYIAKMYLKKWVKWHWADSEYLQQVAAQEKQQFLESQGMSQQEIDQTLREIETIPDVAPPPPPIPLSSESKEEEVEDTTITDQLSDEDKLYLRVKWGKTYKPEEWVQLEKLYTDMMNSYDIQGAGHEDTLKLVCKTSLKSNQLIDLGDVDAAQKMIRMYDTLMKSGKFTANQNKGENGEAIDSVSEIVAICEKDGFIPRYYVEEPKDKVDRVLQDFQSYVHTLVTEEMNLGTLIEQAIKELQADKEKEAQINAEFAGDEDEYLENELFSENDKAILQDGDFEELNQMVEDEAEDDESYLLSLLEEEDL